MQTHISFTKRNVLYGIGIAALIVGGFLLFSGGTDTKEELLTVVPEPFIQQISTSGRVVAVREVDLAFSETGRVVSLPVRVGSTVVIGQALASLASETLVSDLRSAEASLALRRAQGYNTAITLDEVRREQDGLVASAYRKMLSSDLAAVPEDSTLTVEPPQITGAYDGAEGVYRISIDRRNSFGAGDSDLDTFGLELARYVPIADSEPTKLGTRGLYVSFPDAIDAYDETVWNITIPNRKSSSYLANYNAYQEALRTRDRAVAAAETELRSGQAGSVSAAEIRQAEAEIERIQAALAERTLYAPFNGIITAIDAKLGGVAAANETAVSLISAGTLQIESYVPEIHLPFIAVGDRADITLDAYGPDTHFSAIIASIDPAETVRDGVSTYRAVLQFVGDDTRVRSGMTANVTITTDERENVLTVPQGVIIERDGKKYVLVQQGADREESDVTTGAVSSLGRIEIKSGLSSGETVVLSLPR